MQPDLSAHHEPISDLFSLPVNRQDWDLYRLSDDQVHFFNENGYPAGVRILDDWQVERLREELIDLMNPDHPGHHLYYCWMACRPSRKEKRWEGDSFRCSSIRHESPCDYGCKTTCRRDAV